MVKRLLLASLASLCMVSSALSGVPGMINYQGRVVIGNRNFHGTGSFKFALISSDAAATLWSNDGSTAGEPQRDVDVDVNHGYYSILLGDASLANMGPIPATVFTNSSVWLRVWFNDGEHGFEQLTPDQRVGSVGYAMVAERAAYADTVGTVTASALADGSITGAKLAEGSVGLSNLDPDVTALLGAGGAQPQGACLPSGSVVMSGSAEAQDLISNDFVRIPGLETAYQVAGGWRTITPTGTFVPEGQTDDSCGAWSGRDWYLVGGFSSDGRPSSFKARYNVARNCWIPLPEENAPSRRAHAMVVWTGSRLIVWGGQSSSAPFPADGAVYDPATDRWTPMTQVGALSPRSHSAYAWSGTELLIWGGGGGGAGNCDGAKYNPATDTWTPMSMVNAPSARWMHDGGLWTGHELLVWGGYDSGDGCKGAGARYNPETDTWTPMSTVNAPSSREYYQWVWTGSKAIVWGGVGGGNRNDGAMYDPVTDTWTPMSMVNAPSPRRIHRMVWTGKAAIIWGGWDDSTPELNTGGSFDPEKNEWTPLPQEGAPTGRLWHHAVWTGEEMLIFSGIEHLWQGMTCGNGLYSFVPPGPRTMYFYKKQ